MSRSSIAFPRLCLCLFAGLAAVACGSEDGASTPTPGQDASTGDLTSSDAADASDTLATDTIGSDTQAGETLADVQPGDTTPVDAAAELTSCVDVGQCVVQACPPGAAAGCEQACILKGSPAAVAEAVPLLVCFQDKCQKDKCKDMPDSACLEDCMFSRCLEPLLTCLDDGKAGATACGDMPGCFDKCPLSAPGSFPCMSGCFNALTATAKAQAMTVGACVAKSTHPDPIEGCQPELFACLLSGKSGTKGCWELFGCQEKCPKEGEDLDCIVGCVQTLTEAAQKDFMALAPCLGQSGDKLPPQCQAAFLKCIDPSGTKTCWDSLKCIGQCAPEGQPDPGPTCAFGCLHDAEKAAGPLLYEVSGCLGEDDPAKKAACSSKLLQCLAPKGTKTCGETVICAATCGPNSGNCSYGCLEQAKADAAGPAVAAMECFGQPASQACTDKLVACIDPQGAGTCVDIFACAQACGEKGSPACGWGCYSKGTKAATIQFIGFQNCSQECDKQCGADGACKGTCLNQKCPSETNACVPKT